MSKRHPFRRRAALVAVVVTSFVGVGACSSESARRRPDCPDALVLAEAATMTRFAGGGTDPRDVDYEVEIADLLSGCLMRKDKAQRVLLVGVAPVLVVSRGPANTTRSADISFFISVVDTRQTIVNKQVFNTQAVFEGNRSQVVLREDDPPITVDFPLSAGGNPYDYQIIVGLQLSQDQLDYNRKRQAATR